LKEKNEKFPDLKSSQVFKKARYRAQNPDSTIFIMEGAENQEKAECIG